VCLEGKASMLAGERLPIGRVSLLCPPGGAVANLCVVLFVTFEFDSQRVAIHVALNATHVALNAELQCMLPSMPRILSATV
jgi:hypothetical protein